MVARTMLFIALAVLISFPVTRAQAQEKIKLMIVKDVEEDAPGDGERMDRVKLERRIERRFFEGPRDFDPEMQEMRHREHEMQEMRRFDPEKYKLITQINELERASDETVKNYRQSDDSAEKDAYKDQLVGILDQLFDLKIELDELEQKRLEQKVKDLKKRIAIRKKEKEKIIQLHLDNLTGKNDHLRW